MKKGSRGRNGDKDEEDDIVEQGATGSTEKKAKSSKCLFHSLGKARAGACKDTCPARIALGLVHEMRAEDRAKYERVYHEFGATGVFNSAVGTDFVAHLDSLVAHMAVNEVNRKAPDQLRAVDSGNVVIIDGGASSCKRLASWEGFYNAYKGARGVAVCFRRVGAGWQVDPGGSMDWTVSQYWNWYQQEQQQQKDQLPDAAYYLTNIQLTDGDLDEWRRGNTVIDCLSSCGRYDLMRYIHLWDRDVPIPSMKARGYLAPPWLIGTFPHWDGAGSQLSVHTYAFGPGHQLIHVYPELAPFQLKEFLKVCGMRDIQPLPHASANVMDLDMDCWDVGKQRLIESKGIVPETFRLPAGKTIVLPAGRAHAFKKCVTNIDKTAGLMFSIAGDCSFVGLETKSFAREFARIIGCELSSKKGASYSLCELALLQLVRTSTRVPVDETARLHVMGAKVFFSEFIKEQAEWIEDCDDVEKMTDVEEANHVEWVCKMCGRSLANVVLMYENAAYCGHCCPVKTGHRARLRFFDMAELRAMCGEL
jgi:hypothetical protein